MLAISIGPLAFPAQPLVLLVGLWVATLAASRLARGADAGDRPRRAENAVWLAALFGLLAARLAHVAMNAGAYAASPWSILDIRDGGWQPAVGWVVAAAWLAASVLRGRDLRRPVGGAALIGLGVWGAGQGALLLAGGSGIGDPVPRVELTALDDRRGAALPEVVAGRPAVVNLWATWCASTRARPRASCATTCSARASRCRGCGSIVDARSARRSARSGCPPRSSTTPRAGASMRADHACTAVTSPRRRQARTVAGIESRQRRGRHALPRCVTGRRPSRSFAGGS